MRKAAQIALYLYLIVCVGSVLSLDGVLGSLSRILGVPAVLVWLLSCISEKRVRVPHVFLVFVVLFFVWNVATLFWTVDITQTAFELYRYVLIFGCLFIIWDLNRTRAEAETCLQVFVFGGYFLVASMVLNYLTGTQMDNYQGRFTGGGFNPNEPGKIFAITIPIAWYLGIIKEKQRPFLRVANAVYPLVCIFAVLISASRGGLIACVPAFIFILFNLRKMPFAGRMVLVLLAIVAVIGITRVDLGPQMDRLATIGSPGDDQLNGRQEIWAAGWNVFTHNPLIGIGTGAFSTAIMGQTVAYQGLPAHNTFLSIATETGSIGLLLFLALLGIVVWDVLSFGGPLRSMWATCLLCLLLSMGSSAWEIRAHPWLLLMMIVMWNHSAVTRPVRRLVPRLDNYPTDQPPQGAVIRPI